MTHHRRFMFSTACIVLVIGLTSCGGDAPAPGQEIPDADEAEITDAMIEAIQQIAQQRQEGDVIPRLNQAKSVGCFNARFEVHDSLPTELAQGVFEPGRQYDAVLRYANASSYDDRDADFRGLSIKLFGTSGPSLWGDAGQQHFLLNSHPGLFAEDPDEFLAFINATADDALWRFFANPAHWDSLTTVIRGREKIDNPLAITYWSTTPFRHGLDESVAVKYSVRACPGSRFSSVGRDDADFFRAAMRSTLEAGPVCLEFGVQFQGDPSDMPIEDASAVWDEDDSPFQPVASISIAQQVFDSPQALSACERQTFNPWQSLAEHRPLGGVNRVRRAVYSESARFRLDGVRND